MFWLLYVYRKCMFFFCFSNKLSAFNNNAILTEYFEVYCLNRLASNYFLALKRSRVKLMWNIFKLDLHQTYCHVSSSPIGFTRFLKILFFASLQVLLSRPCWPRKFSLKQLCPRSQVAKSCCGCKARRQTALAMPNSRFCVCCGTSFAWGQLLQAWPGGAPSMQSLIASKWFFLSVMTV